MDAEAFRGEPTHDFTMTMPEARIRRRRGGRSPAGDKREGEETYLRPRYVYVGKRFEPRWRMACGAFCEYPDGTSRGRGRDTFRIFGVRLTAWEARKKYITCRACYAAVESIVNDRAKHAALLREWYTAEANRYAARHNPRGGDGRIRF